MTPASVLRTHQKVFYRALLHQDWNALASLYCADLSIRSSLFPCSQTVDHTFQGMSQCGLRSFEFA